MTDRPIGERVMAVEVALREHVTACEKKHDKNFRLLCVVLASILGIAAKMFGLV